MKTRLYWILAFALLSAEAFAKTIVVSDIDDTIRVRHVQNGFMSGFKLLFRRQAYLGMVELFETILESSGDDAKIFYVTNSTYKTNQSRFLKKRGFPNGGLLIRKGESSKVARISSIIDDEKPNRVILFGDNAEFDSRYYREVSEKYQGQGIDFVAFIRASYSLKDSVAIDASHVAFVTPLEPALELLKRGLLSRESVVGLAATVLDGKKVPSLGQEMAYHRSGRRENHTVFYSRDRYFESWQNCEAFKWQWGEPPDLEWVHPLMSVYFDYLKNRSCNHVSSGLSEK